MSAEPAFRAVADLIREHARRDPAHPALIDDRQQLSYGELDALMDRVAAALQRDGVAGAIDDRCVLSDCLLD